MEQNNNQPSDTNVLQPSMTSRPSEAGQVVVQGFVRITDPNTKEVILESRA